MNENKSLRPRFPLFHVPHDGSLHRSRIQMFCIPEEKVMYYHEKMRDKYVAELIPHEYRRGDHSVQFPFSRLQCDTERFKGPEEIMEKYGMGYSYSKAYDGTVINEHPGTRFEIFRYYDRYHGFMNWLCTRIPRVFLIDLHSYHDEIVLKDFLVSKRKTPDLCIGTDLRFTHPEVLWILQKRFREAGLTTDINYPYSGCYIPEKVAAGSGGYDFIAVMLEFHRRTYLDEEENVDQEKAERIRRTIRQVIADCEGITWREEADGE